MKIIFTISLYFISILVIGQTAFAPILNTRHDTAYIVEGNKPFNGNYKEYYPGEIKVKGQFVDGLKDGEFIYYNNTIGNSEYGYCSKDSIVNYKAGKKEGIQKTFFFCPQEATRKNYKNGMLDGLSYYWNLSGQLTKIDAFNNNKLISSKEINIDSNLVKIFIGVKGFKTDTLPSSVVFQMDTIELEVIGNFYSENGYFTAPLMDYHIKSFSWASYQPGSDFIYNVNGHIFPDAVTNLIKRVLKKDNSWLFWINNLVITDKNNVECNLKEFKFIIN